MSKQNLLGRVEVINRFLTFILSIGFIIGLVIVGIFFIKDTFRERRVNSVVNLSNSSGVEVDFSYMISISGGDFCAIPLSSNQTFQNSYYSKSSHSIRNYIIVSIKDRKRFSLHNSDNGIIDHFAPIPEDSREKQHSIIYTSIESDSSGDDRLSREDSRVLWYYSLERGERVKISDSCEKVLGSYSNSGVVSTIYQVGKRLFLSEISIHNMEIIFNGELKE